MYVVTNRKIISNRSGLSQFGETLSEKGPHELRIFNARKQSGDWKIRLLRDKLTKAQKTRLGIPANEVAFASRLVAADVLNRVQKMKKNLLFFVHGFNNDVEAMLERAKQFEELYNVEVIAFSWPANGGGASGVVDYKSDKRDAAASIGALYNTLKKARIYLDMFNKERDDKIVEKAIRKFPANHEKQNQFIARMKEEGCPFTVNLALHSMGNYLFKKMQESSIFDEHQMLFDNVMLLAADTNNAKHADWVDAIECRKHVYVTINEDDFALQASRMKGGSQQKARLGHFLHNLNARNAHYVDFTDELHVGRSHSYFEGQPVSDQTGSLFNFFNQTLNGKRAKDSLVYDPSNNTFRLS